MPARSKRVPVDPYLQYTWKSSTGFSFVVRPAVFGQEGEVVEYSLTPSVEWTATPRKVTFRFTKPAKDGTISWSVA
jgi:hypothetical protein